MSGPVTTVAHLRTRIYEVLVDGAGVDRTLAAADRFLRGGPPAKVRAPARMRDAQQKKRVFVMIGDAATNDAHSSEMSNTHGYLLSVTISRDYWLGYEGSDTEVDAALDAVTDDFFRLRAALCFPGNLTQTTAAAATGAATNALSSLGATSRITFESTADGRLINVRDTFRCHLDFNPDA